MKRLALAALALFSAPAFAATTSTLNVTANITATCSISTTKHLNFDYDPVGTNRVAGNDATDTATFEVICTNPGTHKVTFGAGGHAAGSQRAMAQGTDLLEYKLFDGATELTPGLEMNFSTPAAGTAVEVSITGTVEGGQMVPSGTYTDSVVATVNL